MMCSVRCLTQLNESWPVKGGTLRRFATGGEACDDFVWSGVSWLLYSGATIAKEVDRFVTNVPECC